MDETLYLVDENDTVIGSASRSRVRAENLLHRGVGILVFNAENEVYIHKRTDTKDVFPGMYDMFAGGAVAYGESYGQAARREAAEELGITEGTWRRLFTHHYEGEKNRCFTAIYQVLYEGAIVHQEEEVAWGRFFPLEEVNTLLERWEFVPDGRDVWLHYLSFIGRS